MKHKWEQVFDNDISQIAEIERQSFIDPWTENMFFESMKNENFHIKKLSAEGDIAGFICYYIIADEEAHIASFAVKRQYRGQGLSKIIFKYFLRDLSQSCIDYVTLEVRESNTVAINLYKSMGFESVGIRPKYYQNGENAIIMWLKK